MHLLTRSMQTTSGAQVSSLIVLSEPPRAGERWLFRRMALRGDFKCLETMANELP